MGINKRDLDSWINEGVTNGFCSRVICYTHDHPIELIPDFFAQDVEEPCWSMVIIREDDAPKPSRLSDRKIIEKIIHIICTDGKIRRMVNVLMKFGTFSKSRDTARNK